MALVALIFSAVLMCRMSKMRETPAATVIVREMPVDTARKSLTDADSVVASEVRKPEKKMHDKKLGNKKRGKSGRGKKGNCGKLSRDFLDDRLER